MERFFCASFSLQHDIFPKRAQVFSNSQLDKTAAVAALEKKVIHTEKTMIYNLTTMGNNLSKKKLRPRFFREMNLVLKHGLHVSIPSICKVFLKFHSS